MAAFDYKQAVRIRDAFVRHGVRYLFIGKSGAILLGFADTTQDVDLFAAKTGENPKAIIEALREVGFDLTESQIGQLQGFKDFVQLKNGPFDVDIIFAPDGIERFEDAWKRHVEVDGFPDCHLDDFIASKEAILRQKDLETLPRLKEFRDFWIRKGRGKLS